MSERLRQQSLIPCTGVLDRDPADLQVTENATHASVIASV